MINYEKQRVIYSTVRGGEKEGGRSLILVLLTLQISTLPISTTLKKNYMHFPALFGRYVFPIFLGTTVCVSYA